MYIPAAPQSPLPRPLAPASAAPGSPANEPELESFRPTQPFPAIAAASSRFLTGLRRLFCGGSESGGGGNLTKRQTGGSDPSQNINVTIGVVVGVVLGVFLIGIVAFLYRYRYSVRFNNKKKRRHRRKSSGSKSSKASTGSAPATPAGEAEGG